MTITRCFTPQSYNPAPRSAPLAILCALTTTTLATSQPTNQPTQPAPTSLRSPFKEPIPSAAYELDMVPIPGNDAAAIKPFFMSAKEVTWEAFDVFVYSLDGDLAGTEGADAVTRPSKPYLPPDRGFGHEGFAAICVSSKSAEAFCTWLSFRSGKKYRLATEAEWEHAAMAGATTAFAWGNSAAPQDPAEPRADTFAWSKENADASPHPAGTKKPNAWGLYDMFGNVREWVRGRDNKLVVKGGAWNDPAELMKPAQRWEQDKSWNATDPQVPKSSWWLSDGSAIGFRIVCEDFEQTGTPATTPTTNPKTTSTDKPATQNPGNPTPKPQEQAPSVKPK